MKAAYLLLCLISLAFFASCTGEDSEAYNASSETISPSSPPAAPSTSAPATAQPVIAAETKDYSRDAQLLAAEIENTHPIFIVDGELPENYDIVRSEYLEYTSKSLTRTDFILATQRYLTILSDGHMGNGLINYGLYIDTNWIYENGSLFFVMPDGTLSDNEIVEIGGIPLQDVTAQIDRHYYAENEAARGHQYAIFSRQKEMLDLAGCDISDDKIILTTESEGATETVECNLINLNREALFYQAKNVGYIIKHSMIDDVFYIDLRTFQLDRSVDDTASAIEDAITQGITKFIIDVRGNTGGNSNVGRQLLEAMGMKVPSFGVYIRISDLAIKTHALNQNDDGFIYYKPNLDSVEKNNDIELAVLTDTATFSSATMLGVWVKDGNLGKIVGLPSMNAPTSYGDMLPFQLPESNLTLNISYKKFLRPDATADPKTLIPDILTERDEDALATALEYLRSK